MSEEEIDWGVWPELTDEQLTAAWAEAEEKAKKKAAQKSSGSAGALELLLVGVCLERGPRVDRLHRKVELLPRPGSGPGALPVSRSDLVVVPRGSFPTPEAVRNTRRPGWSKFITGGPVEPLQRSFGVGLAAVPEPARSQVTPVGFCLALVMGTSPIGLIGSAALCLTADALISGTGRPRRAHVPNVPPRGPHVVRRTGRRDNGRGRGLT